MKLLMISTTLLALATAATLPPQKFENQNGLIEENDGYTGKNYEHTREHEELESIPNSFDAIVNNIRLNGRYLTENEGLVKNEISIPDTVNVGSVSDTLFTDIYVKGMAHFASQNVNMLWGEDVVNVKSSWNKLTVDGVYHYTNTAGRYTGMFRIVMADPEYAGNTSLTKNSNTYPAMPMASSVTFGKAFINHTKLPELFQNEKPQFEHFIKNVVCPYIATAMAENSYNEVFMSIRQAARPYLTYQSNKIANDATSFNGLLDNGNRFEFEDIHFVNTQSNLAKISFVQMNNTKEANTVKLHLRLLNLTGESKCVLSMEGKTYSGKVMFKVGPVMIMPILNFNDKKVQTEVLMKNTRVELKIQEQNTIDITYAEEQLTKQLVAYLTQQIAKNTNQSIKNAM